MRERGIGMMPGEEQSAANDADKKGKSEKSTERAKGGREYDQKAEWQDLQKKSQENGVRMKELSGHPDFRYSTSVQAEYDRLSRENSDIGKRLDEIGKTFDSMTPFEKQYIQARSEHEGLLAQKAHVVENRTPMSKIDRSAIQQKLSDAEKELEAMVDDRTVWQKLLKRENPELEARRQALQQKMGELQDELTHDADVSENPIDHVERLQVREIERQLGKIEKKYSGREFSDWNQADLPKKGTPADDSPKENEQEGSIKE